jgi:hypothetical protein
MRFISKSQRYSRTVRQPEMTLIQGPRGPEEKVTRDVIMAVFEQSGLTPYERELSKQRFNFLGQYEGEDPMRRVAIYDTDVEARVFNWDAKTKAEVEASLLEGQNEFYFVVEELALEAPWSTYDKQPPKQIVETLKVTGGDPEYCIAYERENKNRTTLIEELQAIGAEESEPLVAA